MRVRVSNSAQDPTFRQTSGDLRQSVGVNIKATANATYASASSLVSAVCDAACVSDKNFATLLSYTLHGAKSETEDLLTIC